MKKALIILAAGVLMLVIGAVVFVAALSSPTVTGPAFMRVVWDIWMAVGLIVVGFAIGTAVVKLVKRK